MMASMRVTRIADAVPFQPDGHAGVAPLILQGGEQESAEAITVALSHYLPGGTAKRALLDAETVYVVLTGELVVSTEDAEAILAPLDSVHLDAGIARSVENRTSLTASMLVIRARTH